MTPSSRQPGERPSSLDELAAERLLRGQRPPAGAPADEQALSALLAAASAPPSARELSGEARAVAAFTASRPATTGPRHARRVIRRHRPVVRPRVGHGVAAAAALGALTLGGVAAAAYTGSLPSSIQRLAHDHIGAPPNQPGTRPPSTHALPSHPPTALRSSRPPDQEQPGLSAATPAPSRRPSTRVTPSPGGQRNALCTAYAKARLRHDDHATNDAWRKLVRAAGGRDEVFEYCAPVWTGASGGPTYDPQYPHDPWPHWPTGVPSERPPN